MKKITLLFLIVIGMMNFSFAELVTTAVNNVPLQKATDNTQVIALIPQGTEFDISEEEKDFFGVQYKGLNGYIAKKFTDKEETDVTKVQVLGRTMTKMRSNNRLQYWMYVHL